MMSVRPRMSFDIMADGPIRFMAKLSMLGQLDLLYDSL